MRLSNSSLQGALQDNHHLQRERRPPTAIYTAINKGVSGQPLLPKTRLRKQATD
jgi:hypothetical protein